LRLLLRFLAHRAQPKDIIVDWLRINYAMQDRNPVDNIRFYSRYNDFKSFQIPRSKVSFLIPEQYEELAVRIFTRDPDKVLPRTTTRWTGGPKADASNISL